MQLRMRKTFGAGNIMDEFPKANYIKRRKFTMGRRVLIVHAAPI